MPKVTILWGEEPYDGRCELGVIIPDVMEFQNEDS